MSYRNPIIKGFNPDPSICRVGEDYYIVTSSFEYFPGIPIYHSRDLVHWKQIGNCISRQSQLPMERAKASGGIWAPTIRYEKEMFYVTATFDGIGNFIVSAKEPAGEWSNPVWVEMDGIDPSLFFENGKAFYCANDCGSRSTRYSGEGISLGEVDIHTGKVLGETVRIWTGTGGGFLEAPHIYHIGEYYYLLAAEGGTRENHMVTIARGKDIWGPYESCPQNPILTNRNDTSKQIACAGHGDLLEDKDGNWWMVHLGTRPVKGASHLGRETFLMPVVWEDGWPIIGRDKKSHIDVETMIINEDSKCEENIIDLSLRSASWLHIRKPKLDNYVFGENGLTIYPDRVPLDTPEDSPSFIGQRQPDFGCVLSVFTKWEPKNNGDYAGVAIYLTDKNIYRFGAKRCGDQVHIMVEKQVEDFYQIAYQERIVGSSIRYKVVATPEKYDFYYSVGEEEYRFACSASTRFLSCEFAGKCFTGVLCGVFAECAEKTSAKMLVKEFSITLS